MDVTLTITTNPNKAAVCEMDIEEDTVDEELVKLTLYKLFKTSEGVRIILNLIDITIYKGTEKLELLENMKKELSIEGEIINDMASKN